MSKNTMAMRTHIQLTTSAALRAFLAAAALAAVWHGPASAAAASTPAPAWTINSVSYPTNFVPGDASGDDQYEVIATNTGAAPTVGGTITLTDDLPAGLTLHLAGVFGFDDAGNSVSCTAGPPVTCTDLQDVGELKQGQRLIVTIPVDVATNAGDQVTNVVNIAGGGAGSVSASEPTTINTSPANFSIESFDGTVTNEDGSPDTQAGSHPFAASTTMQFNTTEDSQGLIQPAGSVKDIQVDLPAGLVGDPSATAKCSPVALDNSDCPGDSQVGTVELFFGTIPTTPVPVYNMVRPPGEPAEFAFNPSANTVIPIRAAIRTGGDYGLTASISNVSQVLPLTGSQLTFWGVPADPAHDAQRVCAGGVTPCASGLSPRAFLTLPTACLGPQTTTLSVDSWQAAGNFKSASFLSHDNQGNPVGASGCEKLDFSPSISVQPDSTVADSPTGLNVDLHVPQNGDPNGLAEANLKNTTLTLPPGTTVSPSAANGLAACSPAQIGLDNASEPSCPDVSKIGSVEVDTPLLPEPLKGAVYLAQQNNNPFGSLLAIYVTAEGDGVLVKLAGHVVADPVTGQLTTTFDDNPQLPFSDFKLDFFGGPRAALATPEACGTFTTTSSLSPWSGTPAATPSDSFNINSGCVSGFSPSFTAGTQNAQAGAYSPFVLSFSRSDTDRDLSRLSVKLPTGVLAKLAGVSECSDAQLAAAASKSGAAERANPSCPTHSQVGTVETGAGPGPDPFFLGGKAYLTGPYKGAPYGLAVVVPALAGPYDLGTVVVRQALYIDPTTAQVTAVSDPFPTILQGIPLRIRRIDVTLNRPSFTVNPTSCNPMSVTGTLSSTGGLTANMSSRFQVGGCSSLGFSPKLKIALTGKGKTHSGNHPNLTATLTDPSGQANIRSAKVALPLSMALDVNNSKNVCAFATAQAVHGGVVGCPASTIVGQATAVTPLLSQPLTGPVYLVQGIRTNAQGQQIKTLPALLIPLRGQIALDLRAQSSVSGGKLVTTFSTIPDAPVSKFTLQINGGSKGLLVITGHGLNICRKGQVANASFGAQSGKASRQKVTMGTPCGKPARLRVLSHRLTASGVELRVRTSERGRLTVAGGGMSRFSRVLPAGVHSVRVGVKGGAPEARVLKVRVRLTPSNSRPAQSTLRMRV